MEQTQNKLKEMNSLYKWQIYAALIAAFTQRQGNYKPTRANYTFAGFIAALFLFAKKGGFYGREQEVLFFKAEGGVF